MAITFENILKQMKNEQEKLLEPKTMEWYLNQIKRVAEEKIPSTNVPRKAPSQERVERAEEETKQRAQGLQSTISQDLFGRMIFYSYDPKWKQKMPYYDTLPLVFPLQPIERVQSWLGLNMHYLPPYERAKFMDALYTLINTTRELDERSQLQLKYEFLKNASRFRYYKPCIKRYLTSHIRSRIVIIKPTEWNFVLMLPTAKFMKASTFRVWTDSVAAANRGQ